MSVIERGEIVLETKDLASPGLAKVADAAERTGDAAGRAAKQGVAMTNMMRDWKIQAAAAYLALGLVKQVASQVGEFVQRGAAVSDVSNSFKALGGDINFVRDAVQGMISDFDAMQLFNRSATVGLTAQQFKILGEYADFAADKVGGDLVGTAEQLIQALGTGRTRGLKQFGIDIAEGGSKAETAALVLAEMTRQLQAVDGPAVDAGKSVDSMSAAFTNLYDNAAKTVAENRMVLRIMDDITAAARVAASAVSMLGDTIVTVVAGVAYYLVQGPGKAFEDFFDFMGESIWAMITPDLTVVPRVRDVAKSFTDLRTEYIRTLEGFSNADGSGTSFGDFFGEQMESVDTSIKRTTTSIKRTTASFAAMKRSVADTGREIRDALPPSLLGTMSVLSAVPETPAVTTAQAVAWAEQDIARSNANMLIEIQAWRNKILEQEAQRNPNVMISWAQQFASMFTGTWAAMWQEIAAGSGFQTILKMFFDMIGNMAIQLGTLVTLAAIASGIIPIFGAISAPAGIAAGMALTAFGGMIKGLASQMGGSSTATSGAGSSTYGGGYSGNMATAQPSTYNVYVTGGLSTSDEIARAVVDNLRHGEAMGY
jgi:hypothetical protein